MPDDPRTMVHVDSFEVREDGVYITGKIQPGPVADLMKTGIDYWAIRPAHVTDPPGIEIDPVTGGWSRTGVPIHYDPPRPPGRPAAPPITRDWTSDGKPRPV